MPHQITAACDATISASHTLDADSIQKLMRSASAQDLIEPKSFAREIVPAFPHLRRGPRYGGELIVNVEHSPTPLPRPELIAAVRAVAVQVAQRLRESYPSSAVGEQTLAALERSYNYPTRITDAVRSLLPQASPVESEVVLAKARDNRSLSAHAQWARPRKTNGGYIGAQTPIGSARRLLPEWLADQQPARYKLQDLHTQFLAFCAAQHSDLEARRLEAATDITRNLFYELVREMRHTSRYHGRESLLIPAKPIGAY
ncbi:hypothetical protein C5E10_05280 [Pseudoclavibacter sp. RFBG4]|uniref:hypothetical protein n=1 Tax=Pseudoclavibacter sp. RFBG4 TaxID=2080575 RepID=UPI000CE7AD53|nr:hypothetical protein [Pseudoclavibacter sp. RFBG4]PPG35016.1 hypothetical protein C5E10_05280 [Pseudoclavibacter sp. RFBG4]